MVLVKNVRQGDELWEAQWMRCGCLNEPYVFSLFSLMKPLPKINTTSLRAITHYIYLAFLGISSKQASLLSGSGRRKEKIPDRETSEVGS